MLSKRFELIAYMSLKFLYSYKPDYAYDGLYQHECRRKQKISFYFLKAMRQVGNVSYYCIYFCYYSVYN